MVLSEPALRRIEEAGLNAVSTARQLFYDGWLLRLSPGRAKRARSVNAHFGSTLPLAEKIAHCTRVYAARRLPLLFRVTPFAQPPALDAELAARGFVAFDPTLVQVAALPAPPPLPPGDTELTAPSVPAFVERVGAMRNSPRGQREAQLERLRDAPLAMARVVATDDGETVAAGQVALAGDLAGIFDVVTAEGARRRGHGTRVVAWLLAKAWEKGARLAYLQVDESNAPALAVYRRFGFTTAYGYHYRAPPGQCE